MIAAVAIALFSVTGQAAPDAGPAAAPEQGTRPMRFGFDDAGSGEGLHLQPWGARMVQEFGFDLWVQHANDEKTVAGTIDGIQQVDAWAGANNLSVVRNLEGPNWIKEWVDDQGRDWYDHPDGRHFQLYPEEIIAELGRCSHLLGVMYDEVEHMQNCRNMIANGNVPWKPWVYDPAGDRLEDAADRFTEAVRALADTYAAHGVPLFTEHVFPVLFHGFARGGWTATPKILKESWSPVYIACAMGAALQYGTEFWITPDLWGVSGYPGHSVDEYRSALLLAYHMGADAVYTENLAYDEEGKGKGSLILVTGDDYRVTEYGEVTKWFRHEYMPNNPRRYSFRDVRPRVAIVRRPDACWGQATSWLGDRLFGNDDWPSTPTTEAWLGIWHLLTRGVIPVDGLSWHTAVAYPGRPQQVFCPLDGVVVYDDRVGAERLEGVELIFLTGLGVSAPTRDAVAECVRAGAICIALPHLLPEDVRAETGDDGTLADGAGRWIAAPTFLAPHVRKAVTPFLPPFDTIRYRFGDTEVRFQMVDGDPNRLAVSTRDLTEGADG